MMTLLLFATAFMLLMPLIPIFAMEQVKLPEGKIGLIVGAFSVTALAIRPFIGYLLDNYNRKTIYVITGAFFVLVIASYEFVTTLAILLAVRMLHGGTWASITTSASTIVVDIIPPNKRGEGIGLFSMAFPLAMVIGPALGLEVYNFSESFRVVFAVSTAMCVVAFVVMLFVKIPNPARPRRKLVLSLPALYEKRALGLAFMQFCYSFSYSGIVTFLPIFAHKYNIDNASYFFMFYALSVIASRMLVRKTFDLRGPTPIIVAGFTIFALGGASLALTSSPSMFFVSGVLAGFGAGMVMPTISTMTMNIVEAHNRGKANATVMTALDVGMGAGAFVLGIVLQYTSYSFMYITLAFILLVPIAFYVLFEKKRYFRNIEAHEEKLGGQSTSS